VSAVELYQPICSKRVVQRQACRPSDQVGLRKCFGARHWHGAEVLACHYACSKAIHVAGTTGWILETVPQAAQQCSCCLTHRQALIFKDATLVPAGRHTCSEDCHQLDLTWVPSSTAQGLIVNQNRRCWARARFTLCKPSLGIHL
jgi:hypothetical protein